MYDKGLIIHYPKHKAYDKKHFFIAHLLYNQCFCLYLQ